MCVVRLVGPAGASTWNGAVGAKPSMFGRSFYQPARRSCCGLMEVTVAYNDWRVHDKVPRSPGSKMVESVSILDLCRRSAAVWRSLAREKDLVVTSNGKPVGGSIGYDGVDTGSVARRAAGACAACGGHLAARRPRDRPID